MIEHFLATGVFRYFVRNWMTDRGGFSCEREKGVTHVMRLSKGFGVIVWKIRMEKVNASGLFGKASILQWMKIKLSIPSINAFFISTDFKYHYWKMTILLKWEPQFLNTKRVCEHMNNLAINWDLFVNISLSYKK